MRNELYSNWLDRTTDFVLHRVPLGRLTFHDVGVVHQLMAGWSRRRSVEAAITVEHLLKRVLDDYHAGNERCSVNTRMYTMVSCIRNAFIEPHLALCAD